MDIKAVSFIISIIGISILLILSQTLQPKLTKIYDLQTKQAFEKVRIQGSLISQRLINNETRTLLQVKDKFYSIDILFDKPITLPKDSQLEIIGKITEYKNENQITADKIKIIK